MSQEGNVTAMTNNDTLKQLKSLGNEKMRAHNTKHGAGDKQFGVSLGDIRALAKKIRTDHPLALSLWETGNVDAQFLATLLIQVKKLSAKEECICLSDVLGRVTMQVFVRDHRTMIAAPVQCDVDGVPKWSHWDRVSQVVECGKRCPPLPTTVRCFDARCWLEPRARRAKDKSFHYRCGRSSVTASPSTLA